MGDAQAGLALIAIASGAGVQTLAEGGVNVIDGMLGNR